MSHNQAARRTGSAVLTAVLMTLLAGCGGGGGTTPPPSGNPDPNPPPTTTSRLTLTGTVTDAPIANAVVTATVGSQTFTANADANGNYSLEISVPQSATGGFVTLSAKGVGSQSYVEFTSLLGTFSSLLTQAGSDAALTSAENFATQITNVSTALAVLLREANGGQPVTSATLLQTLSATLNSQDVLNLATAIKLLVDEAEDYPMPDGQTSLSALLSNTAAREQLVDAAYVLDRPTFVATQNAIVTDPTVIKPITPTSVPSNLIASTLPTDLSYTYADGYRGIAYTFNADGTGSASTSNWHRNTTWSVTGNSVQISYQTPVNQGSYERGICPGPIHGYAVQELEVDYTINGATLRQLSDRILAVTEDRLITYRECGPSGATEPVTVARTIIDSSNTQSIDLAELRDTTRTLWVYDEFSDVADGNYAVLTVMPDVADLSANGTGTTRVFSKQFTWALDASGKVITATFTDGTVAKYRWLREVETVATDVLYDLALPTGQRAVGAGVSIQADRPQRFWFTYENSLGRHYWLGLGEAGAPPTHKGFRYRLDVNAAGSREDEIVDQNGNIQVVDVSRDSSDGLFWGFTNNQTLEIGRRRTDMGVYNCSFGTPFCVVYDQRSHYPLTNDGARTYSLVLYRSDPFGVHAFSRRSTYIAMYDYEPFNGSATSSKPTVAAGDSAPAKFKMLRDRRHH
jgi:hypothetical protein